MVEKEIRLNGSCSGFSLAGETTFGQFGLPFLAAFSLVFWLNFGPKFN